MLLYSIVELPIVEIQLCERSEPKPAEQYTKASEYPTKSRGYTMLLGWTTVYNHSF